MLFGYLTSKLVPSVADPMCASISAALRASCAPVSTQIQPS